MNLQIVLLLGQDGLTNGAIYLLLALSIVLVFSVTRTLFVPQGEFVTFGAMAMASMQNGRAVSLGWFLLGVTVVRVAWAVPTMVRTGRRPSFFVCAAIPYALVLVLVLRAVPLDALPQAAQALLTLALVVPVGPLLYDLCFRPIASASSLVLMIVSIAVHEVLVGFSLLMFGADGAHTEPFSDAGLDVGPVTINAQTIWILALSLSMIVTLYAFFEHTLYGKALRATAVNRFGAQCVGISPTSAGQLSFTLAAAIGALSGILIAPVTTLYFDSGLMIGLKGFVGAIIGGLGSYPVAALGALIVGLVEAFSTFWASDYKEVIVFMLLLPVLLWRSLRSPQAEDRA